MALDFGRPNNGNHYKNAVPWNGTGGNPSPITLPNADWCIGFWARLDSNAGSSFQYAFSNTNASANAGAVLLYTVEAGQGSAYVNKWHAACRNDAGVPQYQDANRQLENLALGDGTEQLIIFQRRAGRMAYHITAKGGSPVTSGGNASANGTHTLAQLIFGMRSDLDTTRAFKENAGQLFILNRSLSDEEIEALAEGDKDIRAVASPGDILGHWQLETPDDIAPDLSGNGRDLARGGTPSAAEFMFVNSITIYPSNTSHGVTSTSPALSINVPLSPLNSRHGVSSTSPKILVAGTVSPNNSRHSARSTSPTLTPNTVIGPNNATHAVRSTSPALTAVGPYVPPVVWRPESGDVDVAGTVITDGDTESPTVALKFHPEYNVSVETKAEHFHCGVSGLLGRTPVFTLNFNVWRRTTPPAANKMYWIRKGEDWLTDAKQFSNRSVSGSVVTFWNVDAFDADEIEIALTPPVTYGRLLELLEEWEESGYIYEPASAVAFRAANPGAPKFAYFDFPDQVTPNGVQVGGTWAFTIGITDPDQMPADGGPKRKLSHDWMHAGEQPGIHNLVRYIQRMISDEPEAVRLRREFRQHVYFMNLAGLYGGMTRGAAEPGDVGEDQNRVFWSSVNGNAGISDPIPSVDATCAAIIEDFGLTPDGTKIDAEGGISWHGSFFNSPHFLSDFSDGVTGSGAYYAERLRANYGSSIPTDGEGGSPNRASGFYKLVTKGRIYATVEAGYASTQFYTDSDRAVKAVMRTNLDMLDDGWLPRDGASLTSAGASMALASPGGALSAGVSLASNGASLALGSPGDAIAAGAALSTGGAEMALASPGGAIDAQQGGGLTSTGAALGLVSPGGGVIAGAALASPGASMRLLPGMIAIGSGERPPEARIYHVRRGGRVHHVRGV